MGVNSVVELTSGSAGTGKSLLRISIFVLDEWLPDRSGTLYTNVNLGRVPEHHSTPPKPWKDAHGRDRKHESFIRRMCIEASKRYGGEPVKYAKRIRRIPPVVVDTWRNANVPKGGDITGPWDYFEKMDLSGAHIQIDEIHNFCGKGGRYDIPRSWQAWLGEIRHRGCTVEFMTQHEHKLNAKLADEASLQRILVNAALLRDPYFNIPLGDWYELKAMFTRNYNRVTYVEEKIRRGKSWRVNHRYKFRIEKQYFPFYNSFERPHQGGEAGKTEQHEFEKRTRLGVLLWFFLRHPFTLFSRIAIVLFVAWLTLGRGGILIWALFMNYVIAAAGGGVVPSSAGEPEPQSQAAQVVVEDAVDTIPGYEPPAFGGPLPTGVVMATIPAGTVQPQPGVQHSTEREQDLQSQLDLLREERERLLGQAQEDEERRRKASAVVLVTPTEVTFREGYSYRVGDLIDYGHYAGHTVTAINYSRRAVILDDKIILRMGRDDGGIGDADRVPAEAGAGESTGANATLR